MLSNIRFSNPLRSRISLLVIALGGAALFAACAPANKPAETAADEPASADAQPGVTAEDASGSTKKFDDMKPGEQMAFMKDVIVPEMTKVFQAYDPKEFAEVGCVTCHGSRAKKGDFHMPNEELPPLDVSDHLADEAKAHPEMMKFMMEKVTPTMAKLLGEETFNPETGKGFGCLGCHTKAEPSPAK